MEIYYKLFAKLEETLNFFKKDILIQDELDKNKIINLYLDLSSCSKIISENITDSNFDLEELINFKNENLHKYFLDIEVPEDLVSINNNKKDSQIEIGQNQIIIPKFKHYPKSDLYSLLSVNSDSIIKKPLNVLDNKYCSKKNFIEQGFFNNNYDLSCENNSKNNSKINMDNLLTSSCYNLNLKK